MKITDINVGVCSFEAKERVIQALSDPDREKITTTDAKFPVFAESDKFLRAAIAVILGCNVFSSGIPNVGPSAVFAKLRSIKKEVEEEMRNENENENKSKINFETLVMSRL